jgi:hypothetical protein
MLNIFYITEPNITIYNILNNIILLRLTPYEEEIIEDHQCGFQCNRSTTDCIFCVHQALEKKNGNKMRLCISYL